MKKLVLQPSKNGEKITLVNNQLDVPETPIIPMIIGDGIGADIWEAAMPVLEAAVDIAYGGRRSLCWMPVPAGEQAKQEFGSLLPEESVQAFSDYHVGIKGPLATPIGGGFRSINVQLRRALDLFVCLRPVRWIPGVPSPVREPEKVDMVIFRENTEDIYAGVEFEQGSPENQAFISWLGEFYPEEYQKIRFPISSAIGIKPISQEGSQRLIRAAIRYAIRLNRCKVTLIHKGNIMKFTEGAFTRWGYDLAHSEFKDLVYTDRQYRSTLADNGSAAAEVEREAALSQGRVWINDVITDAAFEQTLTRPEEFDVIATMNLNGDLFSDALAAQVGGLGIAPGANLNDETHVAVFEATHGTAPQLAGKNIANPSSLILSGEMMLNHLGWNEAASLVWKGIQKTVAAKTVTQDFDRLMSDARCVSSTEFGKAVIQHMRNTDES